MISGPQPKVTVSTTEFLILSSYGLTSFFVVLDIKIFLGDDEEDDDQDD